MGPVFKVEQQAARLRLNLRIAQLPELKVLCALRFFGLFAQESDAASESYVREFVPELAAAARRSDPIEFLPEEIESLAGLIELLRTQASGVVFPDDLAALKKLADSPEADSPHDGTFPETKKGVVRVNCLFVEYYPDLDLPPRGRLLNLHVSANAISSRADRDDVAVRNPVSEPDDRFLEQARDSVAAARSYLHDRYGLSLRKRYRFDFSVDSTGARFTGDSLGVAFAVGAIAAVAEIEVFRERISVSPDVAFSGALTADGGLTPIDKEALKLKIYRAFHSNIGLLVIPREHLTESWQYVSELEKQWSNRRLELVGADTIGSVASDPRLLPAMRNSAVTYYTRKAWKAKRSAWIEVPALLVLLAVLFYLVAPARYMPWFDSNPIYAISNPTTNSLEVYNRDSTLLWADLLSCPINKVTSDNPWSHSFGQAYDFDSDGRNEIVFLPRIDEVCDDRAFLRFYSHGGQLQWKRNAAILGRYPKDSTGVQYDADYLRVVETKTGPAIVSIVSQQMPARTHIRFWNAAGDSLGWYIHWGHGAIQKTIDIDHDGQQEILFTGFYNREHCVALLVLRPDSVRGFSPIETGMEQEFPWWIPGNQIAYILFPKSDIGCLPGELPAGYNYPGPNGIRSADDGLIQVYVSESAESERAPQMIYTIDRRFRVVKVAMNDILITRRRQLVTEGKLPPIEDAGAYYNSIRDAVTYWTDSGWVTEGQLRASENLR